MRQNKHTHAYEQQSCIPNAYEQKSIILMLMNQNKAYPTHMKKLRILILMKQNQTYSYL